MAIYRPTSIPDPINHELLQEQLAQLGDIGLSKDSISWRVDIFEPAVTNAQVQAVFDAHDGTQKTQAQLDAEEAQVTRAEFVANKVQQALTAIDDELIILNGTPTNAQLKDILLATVQRQRKIIKYIGTLI